MSVQALVDAVEDLHLGLDRAEIAAAFSARDRLDALLALRVAEYEAAALHTNDSAATIQAWLRSECGRDTTTAHRIAVTGRKLRDLPALRDAVLGGRITGGQLRVVLAHIPQRHLARFAEHEHELVPLLEGMSVEDTRRAMEHWRACADDTTEPDADADEPPDEVHFARTLGGRGDVHASLGPDSTALLEAALRVADPKDLGRPLSHRLAHTPGWHLKLLPDGTTELTGPDGRTWINHPRGGRPPDLFGRPPPPAR